MEDSHKEKNQAFGYLIGRLIAIVIWGCLSGCAVGLTIKFIMWLFGL